MVKSNLLSLCRRLLLPKRGFKWLMEQVNLPFPGWIFCLQKMGGNPWVNILRHSASEGQQFWNPSVPKHCWNTLSWASTYPPQHFRLTVSLPRHSVKKVPSFCLKPLSLGELLRIHVDPRWRSEKGSQIESWSLVDATLLMLPPHGFKRWDVEKVPIFLVMFSCWTKNQEKGRGDAPIWQVQ